MGLQGTITEAQSMYLQFAKGYLSASNEKQFNSIAQKISNYAAKCEKDLGATENKLAEAKRAVGGASMSGSPKSSKYAADLQRTYNVLNGAYEKKIAPTDDEVNDHAANNQAAPNCLAQLNKFLNFAIKEPLNTLKSGAASFGN